MFVFNADTLQGSYFWSQMAYISATSCMLLHHIVLTIDSIYALCYKSNFLGMTMTLMISNQANVYILNAQIWLTQIDEGCLYSFWAFLLYICLVWKEMLRISKYGNMWKTKTDKTYSIFLFNTYVIIKALNKTLQNQKLYYIIRYFSLQIIS